MKNSDNLQLKKTKKPRFHLKPNKMGNTIQKNKITPSILMLTTYPPRECGIATYSCDLVDSLQNVFGNSFSVEICPIHDNNNPLNDNDVNAFHLNTDDLSSYDNLAYKINHDTSLEIVMIQHEFGLFNGCSNRFVDFLRIIEKPIIIGFHTVIPNPNDEFLNCVKGIAECVILITVMTESSANILIEQYGINPSKVQIINHGTHLVKHRNRSRLKSKYNLTGKTVLSTFGLLGPGKSIETTLAALPEIVTEFPDVIFLILGKTHPTLAKSEGQTYRNFLLDKIKEYHLEEHVRFVNEFLPLEKLLEYLQLTDIYLFTSKDPNQAVSGTFSYAMSCGCPIISTPIPHAKEFLSENKGLLFDFGNSAMLASKLKILLSDKPYRKKLGLNALHASSKTSWENSALAHGQIFQSVSSKIHLNYKKPEIRLDHLCKMTTSVGLIQFSKLNQPDISSGYTLDDNARALIVLCRYYELTKNNELLDLITIYLNFILNCQRFDGTFLNYVDENEKFTTQNDDVNLEDSNGRAIWALGNLIAIEEDIPKGYEHFTVRARESLNDFLFKLKEIKSPRTMAFIIKGLKASGLIKPESEYYGTFVKLGSDLAKMYEIESSDDWKWFEPYLTYGNSVLPEALLDVYDITGIEKYKIIALDSFNFLLDHLFLDEDRFQVISNQGWFSKGNSIGDCSNGGQQPIDVAYTILALKKFHAAFPLEGYESKMELAFSWFLGNNHLNQIIYNPCTTGCFDGLELKNVNLNQGAESTISYLLARLAFEDISENI